MLLNCFSSLPPPDELPLAATCRKLPLSLFCFSWTAYTAIAPTQWLMTEIILEQCMLQLLIQMPLQLTFSRWMTAATAAMPMHRQ